MENKIVFLDVNNTNFKKALLFYTMVVKEQNH